MRVFYWRFCIDLDVFRVFLGVGYYACISHVYLYVLRRLTRFPPYWVIMRVFHTFICIVSDSLRVFLRIALKCVCFSRFSALAFLYRLRRLTRFPLYGIIMRVFSSGFCIDLDVFRVFFGCGHNACISHVYLYRLRRLTRFPTTGVTMRVFFTFLCTRVSLSFKTSYAFSSVWRHNACVLLAFLHRFRRLTSFLSYGVIMRVFHTFICIF